MVTFYSSTLRMVGCIHENTPTLPQVLSLFGRLGEKRADTLQAQ